MPAQAGIRFLKSRMDSRLRGHDKVVLGECLCNVRVHYLVLKITL